MRPCRHGFIATTIPSCGGVVASATNAFKHERVGAEAVELKSLLQKIIDNRWNVVGLTCGFLLGVAGVLVRPQSAAQPDLIAVSVVYVISFLGLLAYLFMHVSAFGRVNRDHDHLQIDRDEAIESVNRLRAFNAKADEAFTQLSRARTSFDATIISALMAVLRGVTDQDHGRKVLKKALREFMVSICDVAVESIAARNMTERDQFQSNIKLIENSSDGRGPRYRLFSRSSNTKRDRLNTDKIEKTGYVVDQNGYFNILRLRNNTRRFVIIDDIEKKLKDWQNESGEAITEPTFAAVNFYKSCLAVAVVGDDYVAGADIDRPHILLGTSDIMLGAIFIDSKVWEFDRDWDLPIMEELSLNIYSALRSYDSIMEIILKQSQFPTHLTK